jgi:OmcA/MtrC family decaheme c-type cytochrome
MKWKGYLLTGILSSLLLVVSGIAGDRFTITSFHGTDTLLSEAFKKSGKHLVNVAITSATADAGGRVTVNFTVKDSAGKGVIGLKGISFSLAKLLPAGGGESFNKWVPYIWRSEVVRGSAAGNWPNPDGTAADQGYREDKGTLTDNKNGSYRYVFTTNISKIKTPVAGAAIPFERNRLHRITLMMGGHEGPTGTAHLDFVPDGSAVKDSRSIVETNTCKACHGVEFHGHGGDRLTVENCVVCHAPNTKDAQSGESLDFNVMIHKIHAGGELASIPGPDGKVWDDPSTPANEAGDNGRYAIWGHKNTKHEWGRGEFPAVLQNCIKCHQGSGANVDNWKKVPSRVACGSCHDTVNFATGAKHKGGPQTDDSKCSSCHPPSGAHGGITEAHEWYKKDPRNIPEFTVDLTVSRPANGTHFVAGESPVVTVVLKENAKPIDHTTVVEDPDGPEGCVKAGCPPKDGKFAVAYLFVHGPRARRNPVLTTTARVVVRSTGTGPFNLGTAKDLALKIDGGEDLFTVDVSGGDKVLSGTLTVPVSAGKFADKTAATAQEIVTWLNGTSAFKARAIAYLDKGKVAIRSRNLGKIFSIQLTSSDVNTAVFGNNTSVEMVGGFLSGFFPSNNLIMHKDPSKNDPKVAWTRDAITYTLDPVDDLKPGTYVASVEITDRGRINENNYKTPSVAKRTFQVGTATEELAVAGNCASCHQGPDGRGFVLDYTRHYKIFDNAAVDQCGACHDYQPRKVTVEWSGGNPLSKRVHAVHFGSKLNYPLTTVAYANGDPVKGRNWNITFPQDVRNCETCHPAGTTSGSWKKEASRLSCAGCHDSESARAHIRVQTWDPTPANQWNGDEVESCKLCH